MTTPLSIVNILLSLAEMGLAGADGEGCTGAVAGPCPSTATGTADKVASRKESLLVSSNAPLRWAHIVPRKAESSPRSGSDQEVRVSGPQVQRNIRRHDGTWWSGSAARYCLRHGMERPIGR